MSTLDDIAEERQRLSERLAKIDGERAKLIEQLGELEAAERVLSRFSKARPQTPRRGHRTTATETTAGAEPSRTSRRSRAALKTAVSLGDATLRAVTAHAEGVSAEDVRKHLASEFGLQVRPNHLGMALQRHRRGGRLEQRDSLWFMRRPVGDGVAAL